ncbi:NAD-dependent epimerase/dehydratase family protein [Sideroxydans sp. CL21]|uniref:NAD-dependent epimerase/dehydratase family protein n=1 Tax=Sideroxydans sp. CL21 TaxID=2600596 RepID=UPI0012A9A00B|nr:NAD-dependent epimerase/dehydratase family protein [Sideroxydans sp. CL21]VVC83829.1 UDP-glucose 4-epimerase (EC 5.1.3.2) [Sideroxydans sp. CL21]
MSQMRVLVTGGAGFIGSHSVEALLADGAQVSVLDNFTSGKRTNLPQHPNLKVINGDIRDTSAVDLALVGISHVLHLAAQVSVPASVTDPLGSSQHNISGFLKVLDGARRAKVSRFVYASSAAVYGAPEHLPLDETSPVAPLSPYGLEKSINDQYAALYHTLYSLSSLGLRYFNVYGPRQDPSSAYAGVISRFASAMTKGDPLRVYGDGGQTRDFIFVKDVARLNVNALKSTATGVSNIATGHSVTLLELIDALAKCAARTPVIEHAPPAMGDIRHSSASPRKMLELLDPPAMTPLAEGLKQLLEYSA